MLVNQRIIELISDLQIEIDAAKAEVQRIEQALSETRKTPLSADEVLRAFNDYSQNRAAFYQEHVLDVAAAKAGGPGQGSVTDLLWDPTDGTRSDGLHYFFGDVVAAAVSARIRQMYPKNGLTRAARDQKIATLEAELSTARARESDLTSALSRIGA